MLPNTAAIVTSIFFLAKTTGEVEQKRNKFVF